MRHTLFTSARAASPRQDAKPHGTANHERPPNIYARSQQGIYGEAENTEGKRTYAFVVERGALAMACDVVRDINV